MRLISFVLLFFWITLIRAQTIHPDTLLTWLNKNEVEPVLEYLYKGYPQNSHQDTNRFIPEEKVILMLAHYISGKEVEGDYLRNRFLTETLPEKEAKDLIRFVRESSFRFVTNPPIFLLIQEFGDELSTHYDDPRARFYFLQQKISMYQITNQEQYIFQVLREMDQLSLQSDYLRYLTWMTYSLLYCTMQNDSCPYYFNQYKSESKHWLGKHNPYYLDAEHYSLKKDSSTMAGVLSEFAKYNSRKGDIKKAGQLLIESLQMTPDTSTLVLLKIRNQLTLARIYADLLNPSRAFYYIDEAIKLCEDNRFERLRKTQVASTYAYCLMADGQFDHASVELETAMRAHSRKLNCQDPLREVYRSALNAAYRKDFALSHSLMDTARQMDCPEDSEILYFQSMAKGVLASNAGKLDQAVRHFTEANQLADSSHWIHRTKDVLFQEYLCFKSFGKIRESLAVLEDYTQLKDSLYRSGQEVALFDIEARYEKSLKDETIARLDAENQISHSKLSAQKRNLSIAIISLFFLLLILGIIWKLYREVKSTNALLSKAVAEKNILLKEIHHRVKNNLQVISSLLKLQSGFIKDDAAIQAIAEGRSRVQSMALLHQNLYNEDNLKGVNMKEYFDNLIQGLFDTYNISPEKIHLHKNIASISLDVDTVVPLGLITNELISNALKHAFPGNRTGNLFVDLFEEAGNLILIVRDDGDGIPHTNAKSGFGNKLIQSLSQKLEADITTRSREGTEVRLTIREYRKAA